MSEYDEREKRAALDEELGPIEVDPAELAGAAEPYCHERTLVMVEDSRRNALAKGVLGASDLTRERVDRAKVLLLEVVSRGRKKKDQQPTDLLGEPAWTPDPSDAGGENMYSDAVDLTSNLDGTSSIEELFGAISPSSPSAVSDEAEIEAPAAAADYESDDDFLAKL